VLLRGQEHRRGAESARSGMDVGQAGRLRPRNRDRCFPERRMGTRKNHFLRDLAEPVLEEDSHAKVQMRRKVRGLRSIEQAVLRERANKRDFCRENRARRRRPP